MSLKPPPYKIESIDGEPERDDYGNWSAFVRLDTGDSALLRVKGPFPHVGDAITDRVLEETTSKKGSTYLKLVKQQRNGSQARSNGSSQDGPDEAYWAGQNAAKGRAHAQEIAVRAWAQGFRSRHSDNEGATRDVQLLHELIDHFEKDVHAARDRAVEKAGQNAAAPLQAATPQERHGLGNSGPPSESSVEPSPTHYGPTEKQQQYMIDLARRKGMDDAAIKAVLKHSLGVERFADLSKKDCVDRWMKAITEPVPVPGHTDIQAEDPWPPEPMPEPAAATDDVPF